MEQPGKRSISRKTALRFGIIAVGVVIAFELFNGTFCYQHGPMGYLVGLAFVAAGFTPGIAALFTSNPLRTVGAAVCFVPWLVLAFYTDCVMPYQGGGASMIYVAVVMYGFVTSGVGALLTGPLVKLLGLQVEK